jgi:hypothetical protein
MVKPLSRLPLGISDFAKLRAEGMNYFMWTASQKVDYVRYH